MVNKVVNLKDPSVFLPIAMSAVALTIVLVHVAIFGVAHEADEGTFAHIWQILMVLQLPLIAFFAIRYLSQQPKAAAMVLAVQLAAALVACAPVIILNL